MFSSDAASAPGASPSTASNGQSSSNVGAPTSPGTAGTPGDKPVSSAKGKDNLKSDQDAGKRTGNGNLEDSSASPSKSGKTNEDETPKPKPTTSALHLNQYITRDFLHAAALASQSTTQTELIREKRREQSFYAELRRVRQVTPAVVFGPGYQGFGNSFTDGKTQIVYPGQRKRVGGRKSQSIRFSKKSLLEAAEQQEILVPVRLEVDYDKHKLRDTFTWNLHDRTVPTKLFAEQLVEDFHLPLKEDLVEMVRQQIEEQLTDYHPHVFFEDQPLNPSLPYWAYKNDEMRILIKLNITIGHHTLVDQFEWDINNPQNSPEEFAQLLTREMCLSGEFTTAIAHSIREQAQLYTKSLYMTGHPFDGRPIEEEDLRNALLPSPLSTTIRTAFHAKDYTPLLYELNDNDLDRAEKSELREARRKRRRRGGPALPDLKDVPKTYRSQIVSSVLPGAVQSVSELRTHKRAAARDGESESEDSDGSPEPTPQPTPLHSNLTRRQRGAAVNAAAALRQSSARSATPESMLLEPPRHTSRPTPSPLSFSRRADVPESILVKLRVSKDKLIKLLKDIEAKKKEREEKEKKEKEEREKKEKEDRERKEKEDRERKEKEKEEKEKREKDKQKEPKVKEEGKDTPRAVSQSASNDSKDKDDKTSASSSSKDTKEDKHVKTSSSGSPAPSGSTKPPRGVSSTPSTSTPAASAASPRRPKPTKEKVVRSLPLHTTRPSTSTTASSLTPSQPSVPPPAWLIRGLDELKTTYPHDRFEAHMKPTALDPETEQPISAAEQAELRAKGVKVKIVMAPKIKCLDCPGKLYITGPDETVQNFMLHVTNKNHREKVDARVKSGEGS